MKPSTLYKAASVLLVVFAAGHTLGFMQADPAWRVDPLLELMQSTRFVVQGFTRSYWDFLQGAGFTVGIFYVFAAVLAWQLAALPTRTVSRLGAVAWSFAGAFAAITLVSWMYLFWIPIVLSFLVTACVVGGAWRSWSIAGAEQRSVALD